MHHFSSQVGLINVTFFFTQMAEEAFNLQQKEETFNNLTLMTYSYIDPEPIGLCFVGHGLFFVSFASILFSRCLRIREWSNCKHQGLGTCTLSCLCI